MFRYTFTLLGLMLMAGFGMFFGIEIATRGIEQIQGPITGNSQPSHEVNAPVQHSGTA
ncbi:MAG: hypothetical protein K0R67_1932, partial [Paenibacillus sp.]|nr:hypothetical protein [Paenibacillus sp.]